MKRVSFRLPAAENDIFAESAAQSVIGKSTKFDGKPAKIVNAYVDNNDLVLELEIEA